MLTSDADEQTSEGLFVFDNGFGVDVSVGQVVRLLGTVTEFNRADRAECDNERGGLRQSEYAERVIALPVLGLSFWRAWRGWLFT